MNTAIFGGTFNPFHIGHEKMLSEICKLNFIDRVLVIPDFIPPHKKTDYLASDIHRLNMCKLMCDKYKKAEVSDIELKRKGKSYTIDTVLELKGLNPTDKFYFVCGGDMISILEKWYKWDQLIKEISFLAFSRNDDDVFLNDVEKMRSLGADIQIIEKKIPNVSSTEIRNNISIDLLPKEIFDYIIQKGLYNA